MNRVYRTISIGKRHEINGRNVVDNYAMTHTSDDLSIDFDRFCILYFG